MSRQPGFELHPLAARDITEIWEFIAEDSPLAARRVREDILAAIRVLVPFPHHGHRRPDLTGRPLRFIHVHDYLITYAPDEIPLWIVAVMHGRRNPRFMAAVLRSRKAISSPQ
jgi:toxin ParE1/3/4